jgi:hypothetical protein
LGLSGDLKCFISNASRYLLTGDPLTQAEYFSHLLVREKRGKKSLLQYKTPIKWAYLIYVGLLDSQYACALMLYLKQTSRFFIHYFIISTTAGRFMSA